jgi:hypothetical protein
LFARTSAPFPLWLAAVLAAVLVVVIAVTAASPESGAVDDYQAARLPRARRDGGLHRD